MATTHRLPADDPLGLVARSHPLRAGLSEEMHQRRLPPIQAPARLLQIVLLHDEEDAARSHAQVAALSAESGPPLPDNAKHAVFTLGPLQGVWERHAEFATYGFLLPGAFDEAFDAEAFAPARAFIADMPGQVIRATLVDFATGESDALCTRIAAKSFHGDGLVACDVAGGRARIWSDFRLSPDGLGRLLIADHGLSGDEPAQLIQRLQELGNYRNMALLGLPVAQRIMPELRRLEQRLSAIAAEVATPASSDERVLDELTGLSAELARLITETRFRMSATQAYAQIVEDRLASLDVTPIAGRQTLTDFTDRRLRPAVRTCASVSERLEDLSERAAWTSALLRTRIDTALARQNRDLLDSMNRRTRLQLRLQQAVEGLSVVAISYYLVALLGEMVKPIAGEHYELVIAVAAPVAILLVLVRLWHLKRHIRE